MDNKLPKSLTNRRYIRLGDPARIPSWHLAPRRFAGSEHARAHLQGLEDREAEIFRVRWQAKQVGSLEIDPFARSPDFACPINTGESRSLSRREGLQLMHITFFPGSYDHQPHSLSRCLVQTEQGAQQEMQSLLWMQTGQEEQHQFRLFPAEPAACRGKIGAVRGRQTERDCATALIWKEFCDVARLQFARRKQAPCA